MSGGVFVRNSPVRKLYSPKGTLLGTVTFKAQWEVELERRGGLTIAVVEPLEPFSFLHNSDAVPDVRTFALFKSRFDRDAVQNLRKFPGAAFRRARGI